MIWPHASDAQSKAIDLRRLRIRINLFSPLRFASLVSG